MQPRYHNTNWAVFCTARSGSSLVTQLITYYFLRRHPELNLHTLSMGAVDEYDRFYHSGSELFVDLSWAYWYTKPRLDGGSLIDETFSEECAKRKAELLEEVKNGFYPITKNIVGPGFPVDVHPFLRELGYKILRVHRRDLKEQFLSHEICKRTFYHSKKIRPRRREILPFSIPKEHFDEFMMYQKQLQGMTSDAVIYYEDFVNDYDRVFTAIGVQDHKQYIYDYDFLISEKITEEDRWSYVQNKEEVDSWFGKKLD